MISIIVSSYKKHYFEAFSKNVGETIGVPYEIIDIWNPGIMGICKAYNKGAEQAKYENLLFVHEDVLFETMNWGLILVELLDIENLGVLGIAGSDYYGYIPSGCWNPNYIVNIRQFFNGEYILYDKINFKSKEEKVSVIDGVFIACKKIIFDEIKFDQRIKGFHGYDLIYSIQVSKKYQNYVTSEILLKHESFGNIKKEWITGVLNVRNLIDVDLNQTFDRNIEMKNFYKLIHLLDIYEENYFKKIKIILKYCNFKILGLVNVLKIINRLKYLKFLKLK